MKKVLVTGGTGFIGAALIKSLIRRGYNVRSLDNNFRGGPDKLQGMLHDVEIIEGDIRNAEIVSKAVEGMDIVYHLAFINGTRYFYERPELVLEVGLKGTLNVMDAAIAHGVRRYVFASSAEVYQQPTHIPTTEDERLMIPEPKNPRYSYGSAKLIGEIMALHYAKNSALETVIFRPHNIYGPNMGFEHVIPEFIMRMKELSGDFQKKEIEFLMRGSGDETRAFCFVDDAAEGITIVGEQGQPGEIYHVGTEEEISIKSLAKMIAEELHLSVDLKASSAPKGGTTRRCPSISKVQTLGYMPKVSLREGLKMTCKWYKNV